MNIPPTSRRFFFFSLAFFFFVSTASIALQNLVWLPALWILWLYFRDPSHTPIRWDPFLVLTLLWVFTFYLGALLGVNQANSFETVHRYLTILLILFVGSMGLAAVEIRKILAFFIWGTVFCAVCGIGKHYWLHQDRIDSFSGDKIVFGGLLMTALILQLGFLMLQPKNLPLWAGVVLNLAALLLTETRGAWVGLAAGFLILGGRLNRKWLLAGLMAGIVGYFFMPVYLQDKIKSITRVETHFDEKHEVDYSDQTRILIWDSGLRIIRDYPWGIGQGNIGVIFPRYHPKGLVEVTEPHLHNNFLQITVQNGWQGLTVYLGWIFCFFLNAIRFKGKDLNEQNLNWTMTCCFIAALAWGLTEFTFAQQFMYLQFALIGLQLGLWNKEKLIQHTNT